MYTKPKKALPERVSLHDCKITDCEIHNKTLKLEFAKGFYVLDSSDRWKLNGKQVNFTDIDSDFCSVRILGKKKYRKYDIQEFPKLLKKKNISSFEIVDQYFGYNSVMLCGVLWKNDIWKQFQLELYYDGDMIYEY